MTLKGAGGSKLSQLVADHVFGNIDGDVLLTVMDGDGVTHELREDGGGAGPGLQDLLLASFVQLVDSLQQLRSHEGALLNASAHLLVSPFLFTVATTNDLLVGAMEIGRAHV